MAHGHRFSVRDILLGDGEPDALFRRCLLEAKDFLETATVAALLDLVFEKEEHRRAVRESVRDLLHVGFLVPQGGLTTQGMSLAASEAGFPFGHSTGRSAVVARELGELAGRSHVPTTIFSARVRESPECSSYVEAFMPEERDALVREWIGAEVGTHIGLILADPSAFSRAQDAFRAEGFQIASFMNDKPITNSEKGVSVVYFDKPYGGGSLRMEILRYVPAVTP
jgi:hypothetical protein